MKYFCEDCNKVFDTVEDFDRHVCLSKKKKKYFYRPAARCAACGCLKKEKDGKCFCSLMGCGVDGEWVCNEFAERHAAAVPADETWGED